MRVRWSASAITDLRVTWLYIADESPSRATRMLSRIRQAALRLEQFPQLGRPGEQANARELVVARSSYIVVYRLDGDAIEILRVLHGAQRQPD